MDTDYTDDIALLDNFKDAVFSESTYLLSKYAAQAGLCVNAKKTEAMTIAKRHSGQ